MLLFEDDESVYRLAVSSEVLRCAERLGQVPLVHLMTREVCLKIPTDQCAVDTSREDQLGLQVEAAAHDIVFVNVRRHNWWQVAAGSEIIVLLVSLTLVCQRSVLPDVKLLVPADGEEAWSLDLLLLLVENADQASNLRINLRLFICAKQILQLLAV